MRRALAALALVGIAALAWWPEGAPAQWSGATAPAIDIGASGDTIPGAEQEFWVNDKGALTRYDATLGERLSVGFDTWELSLSNASAGAMLKMFHGIDTDTSYGSSPVGLKLDHDGMIGCFCFSRNTPGGASTGTLFVYVGDATQRVTYPITFGNFDTHVDADTSFKVYEGESIAARFVAGGSVGNNRVTFHVFDRDSTGGVVP